jgi:hypothetical protein
LVTRGVADEMVCLYAGGLGSGKPEFSSGGSYYGARYGAAVATVGAAGIVIVETCNEQCRWGENYGWLLAATAGILIRQQ